MSNALILGPTGMVGSEVLGLCLANNEIDHVLSVGRRASGVKHSKLTEIVHRDFLDFSPLTIDLANTDVVFYCLGVYQAKVSKRQFWEITVDYLAALAQNIEQSNKHVRFCLFSAQGASTTERSPIRFARAKGRAENILLASGIKEKYIFRPGFIMPGPKFKSVTLSARLFEPVYRLFPMIGIDAPQLARVMVDIGINRHEMTVFENRDIRTHAGAL